MAGLKDYEKKRDFGATPEPKAKKGKKGKGDIFVIQKHDASNLHYDLRLEIDGVLKSWAVPKGPSTDPREKRLAAPTEDHPLDYSDFEGVIPEGEYGAGEVIIWDRGKYRNLREKKDGLTMAESYKKGQIEVFLKGRKLKGGYALVRTGSGKRPRWLLIKMKDEHADARRNPTSTEPNSVISGRTIEGLKKRSTDEKGERNHKRKKAG